MAAAVGQPVGVDRGTYSCGCVVACTALRLLCRACKYCQLFVRQYSRQTHLHKQQSCY